MAKTSMEPGEIVQALTSLLTNQAEAIGWVSQQKKSLSIELPNDISEGPKPGGCLATGTEAARTESEILIAILKLMNERGGRRPGSVRPK